jgi:hypothetical protein
MKLTVYIPVYDPASKHEKFLDECLESISNQSLLPASVILSGNQLPKYLEKICSKYRDLNISVIENDSTSAVDNLNFIPKYVKTPFTKILFQDDVLYSRNLIEECVSQLSENAIWVVCASKHLDLGLHPLPRLVSPRYSLRLAKGINTLGSPSSVAFKTSAFINFDEKLRYMYDCDWYLSMAHSHGRPRFIRKTLVGIRIHEFQATNTVKSLLPKEIVITKSLHSARLFSEIRTKFGMGKVVCSCQGSNRSITDLT